MTFPILRTLVVLLLLGSLLSANAASSIAERRAGLVRQGPRRRQTDACTEMNCDSTDVDDSDCFSGSLLPVWTADGDITSQLTSACSGYSSCLGALGSDGGSTLSYFAAISLVDDCKGTAPANVALRTYNRNTTDIGPLLDIQVADPVTVSETAGVDDAAPDGNCSDYSCQGDCNDWVCFDAAFGTATADIKTACSGYSKCVDEKCPAGQTLSYASGVVYEVDCGMTMPTARSRKYPKAFSAVGDGTVAEAGSTNKPGSGAASTKISTITLLSSIVIGIAVLL